jgi:hypothetical protein
MSNASDIVGYTYRAGLYCPRCIGGPVGKRAGLSWADFGYPSEITLNASAVILGIDRDDESTFDSGEFPKVLPRCDTFTVLYTETGFVVARGQWNSPRDGYRAQRDRWAWCGSDGWRGSLPTNERYEALTRYVEDFASTRWHDNMWDTFTAPCFPGLERHCGSCGEVLGS